MPLPSVGRDKLGLDPLGFDMLQGFEADDVDEGPPRVR